MRYEVTSPRSDAVCHKLDPERIATPVKEWSEPSPNFSSNSQVRKLAIGLVILVNVVLLITVVLILTLNYPFHKTFQLCTTDQCISTASRVINAMDKSVDPCVDFYQFACGGWIKLNPVPDWTATWDRLTSLRETLLLNLRALLETEPKPHVNEPLVIQKIRTLYRTCMNTDAIEAVGTKPVEDILQSVGLTATPPYRTAPSGFDWLYTVARTRRILGNSVLFSLAVTEDVRNTSRNKIVIEQVTPGFSERFLLHPKKYSSEISYYKKYIVNMIRAYTNYSNVESLARDILNFSTSIAQIMSPAEVRRSSNYLFHEINLQELADGPRVKDWKMINWTRYMNIVFNDTSVALNPKTDRVIILDLPYLTKLTTVLKTTNPLMLEKFIWWNIFSTVAPLTLERFRTLGFEFSRKLVGLQEKSPRWKTCTANVNTNFGLALSYLYIREHFNEEDRNQALEMLWSIRDAFQDAVGELDWMDNKTRNMTLLKLHAIRAFVGYPGWVLNETQLDKYYKGVHVTENELFKTYLNLTYAHIKKNLESIRKKPDRDRWVAPATTVNAFYSATLNSVTFPAGILQPPFYGNGILALDYGSIGAIMGHEITHGFDDQGRRYDENGNLKQWWTLATLEHYHNKIQCIVEQYSNYTLPELGQNYTVHGFNTQGENIADNGGLRAAYDGYRKRIKDYEKLRLPGLQELSADQLFYLGFAQVWCGNSTLGALKTKLIDGVHSPNKIRVIGTLSNSETFAQAWNCPIGSPMNPEHKCVLW